MCGTGTVYMARASGLLEQFDPPELTMNAAIERQWTRQEDGPLLVPKPVEYLPAYPLPSWCSAWSWANPFGGGWPSADDWIGL